jgi:exopolyphosphatase/guanosine-5'-triphosphate,3'-diphosphate pyrophosphatase
MKLAVIDCGTNTFNLIIVEVTGQNRYNKLFHTRVPVKLGEGTINGGYIDEKPFNRGLEAIRSFNYKIREEAVDKVLAFATSAIRDGSNGKDFVRAVKQNYDIELQVINGEREAELVYSAVREAVELGGHVSLIMDIGGGSTEFILADKDRIFWKQSFTIGAARLLDKFRPSDRITANEIITLKQYLGEQLQPLTEAVKLHGPIELVGSSGAFESFVEMIHGEFGGEEFSNDKTSFTIKLEDYRRISDLVIATTMEQRKKIKGLIPMRFDMIVICCLLVDFVLENYKLQNMRMSVWSLKEGAMVDFVKQYV